MIAIGRQCCAPQTLNEWVKKIEFNTGQRGGITIEQADKMKALEREVREPKQANEILRKASAYFIPSRRMSHSPAGQRDGARPPTETMIQFIEDHRGAHGGEPICPFARQGIAPQCPERGFRRLPLPRFIIIWPSRLTLLAIRIAQIETKN